MLTPGSANDASISAEESVRNATQAFAGELERRIRVHPHLWYQFYPYWEQQAPEPAV